MKQLTAILIFVALLGACATAPVKDNPDQNGTMLDVASDLSDIGLTIFEIVTLPW